MATTKRTPVPGEVDKLIVHSVPTVEGAADRRALPAAGRAGPCRGVVVGGLPGCGVGGGIQCPL